MNIMLDEYALIPNRAHKTDAGLDLFTPENFIIWPGKSVVVDTGVHVQIPHGMVGLIKSKSGLNMKYSIVAEGVIDEGYTGSIVVKLYNHGDRQYCFERGDKLTQLVVVSCCTEPVKIVKHFDVTERGDNGFGSTGR